MFERNRVDSGLQTVATLAEITLDDGRSLKGKFFISAARSLADVLNGEMKFLEFETHDGDRTLIAKSSIRTVKAVPLPSAPSLKNKLRDTDNADPFAMLGIDRTSPWEEIRIAYHKLSKLYHPDRYASFDLPPEVSEYLAVMARRINAAYTALEIPHEAAKRSEVQRAKPVYSSPQRF